LARRNTGVFEHVGPLSTGSSMAVFEMLPEVVCPVKLLAQIAFAELVHISEMTNTFPAVRFCDEDPVCVAPGPGKLFTAVTACILLAWFRRAVVESLLVEF